jgi:hypothetical protein
VEWSFVAFFPILTIVIGEEVGSDLQRNVDYAVLSKDDGVTEKDFALC